MAYAPDEPRSEAVIKKKAGDGRIGHDESHERYHFFLELIAVGLATFLGFCGAAALFLWLLTL